MRQKPSTVNGHLLFHKLLLHNINGKKYLAIKVLYWNTLHCIQLNGCPSKWLLFLFGVRQWDILPPTLFKIFISDLIDEVIWLKLGIQVGERRISMPLYADDMAFVAENETSHFIYLVLQMPFNDKNSESANCFLEKDEKVEQNLNLK